jgi:fructose-1-phosphate kinase PfkB-like protein
LILTLTINPAVDRTIISDRLAFEDRGYILERREAAGGRGVNASQVIHSFGGKTLALTPAMESASHGAVPGGNRFPFEVVRVKARPRNLTISGQARQVNQTE